MEYNSSEPAIRGCGFWGRSGLSVLRNPGVPWLCSPVAYRVLHGSHWRFIVVGGFGDGCAHLFQCYDYFVGIHTRSGGGNGRNPTMQQYIPTFLLVANIWRAFQARFACDNPKLDLALTSRFQIDLSIWSSFSARNVHSSDLW